MVIAGHLLHGPPSGTEPTVHVAGPAEILPLISQCSPCMSSRLDEYRQKAGEAKNRAAQTANPS
jgi:hypothetical protein